MSYSTRAFTLLAATLVALPVAAQKASVKSYLPADSALVVHVPDLPASIGEFSRMPLAKMWREPEVQDFVADLMEMVKAKYEEALAQAKAMHQQGMLPIDPEQLLKLRIEGGTLAITKMNIAMSEFGPSPEFGIVLHLDFGDTAPQWTGMIQMLLGMMEQEAGEEIVKEETKVGNFQLTSYMPNMPVEVPMSLNVAMIDKGIVIGTLRDEVKAILQNMQDGKAVLSESLAYKSTVQHLNLKGAECELFMRPQPFMDLMVTGLGIMAEMEPSMAFIDAQGVDRALDALGLRAIKAVGATANYKDGKSVSQGYVVAPAPDRKGLLAGSVKNLDMGFLRWVPRDAVSFSATTVDAMGLYDGVIGALRAYDPQFADGILKGVEQYEKQLGFSIKEDLFGAVGDTFVTWSMPMGAITSAPEMAFLLKVKDKDRLLKTMRNVLAMSDGMLELEDIERRGIQAHQIKVNFDPTGGMGMNVFEILNPTFAFKEGYMVAGFSISDIKRVFDRMEREDDPKGDIRGNKEFSPYLESLPAQVQSLSFTDWKANFEGMYQMVTGLLAFMPVNQDVPLDLSLLPYATTLTQHLFGAVSYSQADGNGYSTTTISPFGPEMVFLAAVAVGVGAGLVVDAQGW